MSKKYSLKKFLRSVINGYAHEKRIHIALVVLYVISFLVLGIQLFYQGPILTGDSSKYINMSPQRSAGYPVFLSFFKVFGQFHLNTAIIVQIFINVASLLYFVFALKRVFNFSNGLLFLALPLLLHFMNDFFYANYILTESLSIPIFLLTCLTLFKGVKDGRFTFILIAVALNSVGYLIRGQMIFMYPVFIMCIIYMVYNAERESPVQIIAKQSLAVILIFVGSILINNSYHYIKHGVFTSTPSSGMALAANAFYVSDHSNRNLFHNKKDQELFATIYDTIYAKNYILKSFLDSVKVSDGNYNYATIHQIDHYSNSFNEILHRNINRVMQDHFDSKSGIERWVVINNKSREIAYPLIKENLGLFLKNNFLDVAISGFQDRKNILIFSMLFFLSLYGALKKDNISFILFLSLNMHVLNCIVMAIGGRVLYRYTIYTEFIIYCLLLIIITNYLLRKN